MENGTINRCTRSILCFTINKIKIRLLFCLKVRNPVKNPIVRILLFKYIEDDKNFFLKNSITEHLNIQLTA